MVTWVKAATMQTHCVSVVVQKHHVYAGMEGLLQLVLLYTAACVHKVDVGVQPTVIHQAQFSAVSSVVISVTPTIPTALAALFAITGQAQDHAVQNPTVETSTNEVDSAAPHSGPAIQTAHVQHTITQPFLQACLPVTAVLLVQVLNQITDFQSGQEWDSISSAKVLMP